MVFFSHPAVIALAIGWGVLWIRFLFTGRVPGWWTAISWLGALGLFVLRAGLPEDAELPEIWSAVCLGTGIFLAAQPFAGFILAAEAGDRPHPPRVWPVTLTVLNFAAAACWGLLWALVLLHFLGRGIQP